MNTLKFKSLLFEGSTNQYYRALMKYVGNNVRLKPKGHYEETDEDGNLVFTTGNVIAQSEKKELSASKYIGGAMLGAYSALAYMAGENPIGRDIYIYTIPNKPDKDLSHLTSDDFEFLQEVRYTKPVLAKFFKKIKITKTMDRIFDNFYNFISGDDSFWNELPENEKSEVKNLSKFLKKIK